MKKKIWLLIDLLLIVVSLLVTIAFYNIHPSQGLLSHMAATIPMLVILTLAALWKSNVYKAVLRYASLDVVIQVLMSTLPGTGLIAVVFPSPSGLETSLDLTVPWFRSSRGRLRAAVR